MRGLESRSQSIESLGHEGNEQLLSEHTKYNTCGYSGHDADESLLHGITIAHLITSELSKARVPRVRGH